MKNKKGFTLIELLAVIVILSIIMIIAVPKIINIIEEADRRAYENSVNLMVEAARLKYQTGTMKGEDIKLPLTYIYEGNKQTNIEEVGELVFKGDKANSGTITVNQEGKIVVENLVSKNKKWCAVKQANNAEAKVGRASVLGCSIDDNDDNNGDDEEEIIKDKEACSLEQDSKNENIYYVDSVSDLYELSKEVNEGNNYSGKIIKLRNNIDMKDTSNKCGLESFEPIGNNSKPFSGTFEGLGNSIKNLVINKQGQDDIGLFGNNSGTIKGLSLENIDIKGKSSIGGLVGRNNNGKISDIIINGKVEGTGENIGGLVGVHSGTIANIIMNVDVNKDVTGATRVNVVFGNLGIGTRSVNNVIIEGGEINGRLENVSSYSENVLYNEKYASNLYSKEAIGDINTYETYIDTYIGGDDDDSGYYFDYDSKGKLVIKSIEKNPIEFNLKGKGTQDDPYLIENYEDWKEATTKVDQVNIVFKLTKDIDFTGKKFYMLGSYQNQFNGHLIGDGYSLKNVNLNGGDYQGIIGYVGTEGIVEGINVKSLNTNNTFNYVGVIGYNKGIVKGINIYNVYVIGRSYIGGLVGYNEGKILEITIEGNIYGVVNEEQFIGGAVGLNNGTIRGILANVNVTSSYNTTFARSSGGLFGQNGRGTIYNSVIETGNVLAENIVMGRGASSYDVYYCEGVTTTGSIFTKSIPSIYINDLTYYDSMLNDKNEPLFESKYTGDMNDSGYFFDYNSDGKIYVVKAYNMNYGDNSIDENYTMTHIEQGASDQTPPVCTLDYVVAVKNGIRASFSCTDESGAPTIRSLFDSTTSLSASTYEQIGTNKNGVVNGNTRSIVSTWTIYDPVSVPKRGQCYYFRYGGQDKAGNFSTYVTKRCYTGFSN